MVRDPKDLEVLISCAIRLSKLKNLGDGIDEVISVLVHLVSVSCLGGFVVTLITIDNSKPFATHWTFVLLVNTPSIKNRFDNSYVYSMNPLFGEPKPAPATAWLSREQRQKFDWQQRGGTIEQDEFGSRWLMNGVLHREDGPAIEYDNGDREWYQQGVLHRNNGPALVSTDREMWFRHGKIHREDGPAIVDGKGNWSWYSNGVAHRDGGLPAIKHLTKFYYMVNGQLHREGGPAVYSESEKIVYECWMIRDEYHRDGDLPALITKYEKAWYQNGKLHREVDKPARIKQSKAISGDDTVVVTEWRIRGELHRNNGPAFVKKDSRDDREEWYQHGKLHRDGAPAAISSTYYRWYSHGAMLRSLRR